MTNYRQERMEKEKRHKIIGALFVIFLIFILGRGPIFTFFGKIGHLVGLPVWHAGEVFEDSSDYAALYVKSKKELVNEVISTRKQLEMEQSNSTIIEALRIENDSLKSLNGRVQGDKHVLARVLSRPPAQIYDTLIINAGENDGIVPQNIVYVNNDFAIGRVVRVTKNTSVVSLFSAPSEHYPVILNSKLEKQSKGTSTKDIPNEVIFYGIGGGGFMAQIPKHINIAINTPMVIPALKTSIIGIITGESVPPNGSLKEVYGTLPFSMNSIDWVTVDLQSNFSSDNVNSN